MNELVQRFDDEVFCSFLRGKFAGFSESRAKVPVAQDAPYVDAERLGIVKTLPGTGGANKPLLVVAAKMPDGVTLSERSSRVRQFTFAKTNYGVHTLPNLETKFVAADSLVGLPRGGDMLPMQNVEALKRELWDVRHQHFLARSYQEKKELRKEDKRLREALAKALEEGGGFDTESARLMAAWDPYDQNTSAPFSDPEWMFNVKDGFDVVIGNPPYGKILSKSHEAMLSKRWPAFRSTKDAYVAFILYGIREVRDAGIVCFIVPSAWLGGPGYEGLRMEILERTICKIIALPFDMFASAYVDNSVIIASSANPSGQHTVKVYAYPKKTALKEFTPGPWEIIRQEDWRRIDGGKIIMSEYGLSLQRKVIENCDRELRDVLEMKRGVLLDKGTLRMDSSREAPMAYFAGDVYRYVLNHRIGGWVNFGKNMKECPKSNVWFRGERLLLRRLVNRKQRLMSTLTRDDFLTNKNLYSLLRKPGSHSIECLLGIINSLLLSRLYIDAVSQASKDDFPQVTISDFLGLPFPTTIGLNDETSISALVTRILAAKKADPAADTSALEAEIDQLVYQLYGLTEEEIAIVEGAASTAT